MIGARPASPDTCAGGEDRLGEQSHQACCRAAGSSGGAPRGAGLPRRAAWSDLASWRPRTSGPYRFRAGGFCGRKLQAVGRAPGCGRDPGYPGSLTPESPTRYPATAVDGRGTQVSRIPSRAGQHHAVRPSRSFRHRTMAPTRRGHIGRRCLLLHEAETRSVRIARI